jgi:hypothetical protein
MYFFTRDLNLTRVEPGLGAGFVFHSWVHPKPKKPERNLKESETRKKPKKTPKEIYL